MLFLILFMFHVSQFLSFSGRPCFPKWGGGGREGWWEVGKGGREGGEVGQGDTRHLSSLQLSVVIDSDGPTDWEGEREDWDNIIDVSAGVSWQAWPGTRSRHSWESEKQQTTTAWPPYLFPWLLDSSQPILYLWSKCCRRALTGTERRIIFIIYNP